MPAGYLHTMRDSGLGGIQPLARRGQCARDTWGDVRPATASSGIGGRNSGSKRNQRGRTGMWGALA